MIQIWQVPSECCPSNLVVLVQGYEQGVPGMCKGETRTLTVPPRFGYGTAGIRGNIFWGRS